MGDLLKAHGQLPARLRPNKPHRVQHSARCPKPTHAVGPLPPLSSAAPPAAFLSAAQLRRTEVTLGTHPDGRALLHKLQQLGLGRPRVPQHQQVDVSSASEAVGEPGGRRAGGPGEQGEKPRAGWSQWSGWRPPDLSWASEQAGRRGLWPESHVHSELCPLASSVVTCFQGRGGSEETALRAGLGHTQSASDKHPPTQLERRKEREPPAGRTRYCGGDTARTDSWPQRTCL